MNQISVMVKAFALAALLALWYNCSGKKDCGKKVLAVIVMPTVVGVSFRRGGKIYYFDPGEIELKEGDFVIAETSRGIEFGEVMIPPREVPESELVAPLKKIVRMATGDDLQQAAANRDKEREGFEIAQQKIEEHGLDMKLLDVECNFEGTQIIFYFSAEGRVDFRELVRELAGALKTKVQLHQIGVRDEAKLIGGYGPCGRELCCALFLTNFEPISMKMAKDQSLFLNPAKFSGICGKLMCCLSYEHEFYKEAKEKMPHVGAVVETERGQGKVVDVNVVSETLLVELEGGTTINVSLKDLNLAGVCRKHGVGCPMQGAGCKPIVIESAES